MTPTRHTVEWGNKVIEFSLLRTDRKRVAIEVNPDLSVLVKVPTTAELEPVLGVVRKKARWILRQQRYFGQFAPRTPPRRFVSGETHLYAGRRYRLKVHTVDGAQFVKLAGGYLHVYCRYAGALDAKRQLLEDWYLQQAVRVMQQRLETCIDHRVFRDLALPPMSIRRLRKRWGSCTKSGRVLLNLDLIRAPRNCIDYVITHELCHLLVPEHSSAFFRLLDRVQPDWLERKTRLEALLV
ncbi:MAG: M48 family metallopeptidase [Planctomycetes bacterium]|nr:M48 family metallopeptidase [Planctomycetota bacterium]